MSAINSLPLRAFLVGLAVFVGLPPLLLLLILQLGDAHGGVMFLIMSPLAGAYPFSAATTFPPWLGVGLSVLQMAGLAAVFAKFTRRFRVHEQLIMALIGLSLLAMIGTLAYGLLGVEISNASFPWF